jgi:hypothetical protein
MNTLDLHEGLFGSSEEFKSRNANTDFENNLKSTTNANVTHNRERDVLDPTNDGAINQLVDSSNANVVAPIDNFKKDSESQYFQDEEIDFDFASSATNNLLERREFVNNMTGQTETQIVYKPKIVVDADYTKQYEDEEAHTAKMRQLKGFPKKYRKNTRQMVHVRGAEVHGDQLVVRNGENQRDFVQNRVDENREIFGEVDTGINFKVIQNANDKHGYNDRSRRIPYHETTVDEYKEREGLNPDIMAQPSYVEDIAPNHMSYRVQRPPQIDSQTNDEKLGVPQQTTHDSQGRYEYENQQRRANPQQQNSGRMQFSQEIGHQGSLQNFLMSKNRQNNNVQRVSTVSRTVAEPIESTMPQYPINSNMQPKNFQANNRPVLVDIIEANNVQVPIDSNYYKKSLPNNIEHFVRNVQFDTQTTNRQLPGKNNNVRNNPAQILSSRNPEFQYGNNNMPYISSSDQKIRDSGNMQQYQVPDIEGNGHVNYTSSGQSNVSNELQIRKNVATIEQFVGHQSQGNNLSNYHASQKQQQRPQIDRAQTYNANVPQSETQGNAAQLQQQGTLLVDRFDANHFGPDGGNRQNRETNRAFLHSQKSETQRFRSLHDTTIQRDLQKPNILSKSQLPQQEDRELEFGSPMIYPTDNFHLTNLGPANLTGVKQSQVQILN